MRSTTNTHVGGNTSTDATMPARPRKPGKLELIRNLLIQPAGATMDELVVATGWQPHSVRAGMTGLRKQGYVIERSNVDSVTRFAIGAQPTTATT